MSEAVLGTGGTGHGNRLAFALADLTPDDGWDAAVDDVDYVLHVASPLGKENSRDPEALMVPARDGARRVLRAAAQAGVKRVAVTSAANAASPSSYSEAGVSDESLWTDPNDPSFIPYRKLQTVAERAAWDFKAGHPGTTTPATILPGAGFGQSCPRATWGRCRSLPAFPVERCLATRASDFGSWTCGKWRTSASAP